MTKAGTLPVVAAVRKDVALSASEAYRGNLTRAYCMCLSSVDWTTT